MRPAATHEVVVAVDATLAPEPAVERWAGTVALPMGKVEITVDFTPDGQGGHTATLGLPGSGLTDLPLAQIKYTPEALGFTLEKPKYPGAQERYEARREPNAGEARGIMMIRSRPFELALRRLAPGEAFQSTIRRPQTPASPGPYGETEVVVRHPGDGTQRSGVLTEPIVDSRSVPAVVLVSGSGAHDRDATLSGHKSLLVWADHLTRQGIAVLRLDDRGVGASTGVQAEATYEVMTEDLLAAAKFLRERPGIDPARVGVMGHSEGGTIAPMAAAREPRIAFVVMLCGMALPGDEVMMAQKRMLLEAAGVRGDALAKRLAGQRTILDAVKAGATEDALRKILEESFDIEVDALNRLLLPASERERLLASGTKQVNAQDMRSLIRNQPATYLRKVRQPLLAVYGEKDLQIEATTNAAALRSLLAEAKHPDYTVEVIARMSHNFQPTDTGRVEEYGDIEVTVMPELLTRVGEWMRKRAGLP